MHISFPFHLQFFQVRGQAKAVEDLSSLFPVYLNAFCFSGENVSHQPVLSAQLCQRHPESEHRRTEVDTVSVSHSLSAIFHLLWFLAAYKYVLNSRTKIKRIC